MEPSRRIRNVEASATLAISDRARELERQGIDVVRLSAGEPDFDTPEHIKEAAVRAIREGKTKYTPSAGIPELRESIAERIRAETGLPYEPGQVVVTSGAKFAIYSAVLALCDPGDEGLVFAPYWVSYPAMLRLASAGVRFASPSSTGEKVTPDALREALSQRTKVIIFNNPCNPSGAVYTGAELDRLVEVFLESGAFVLADEVYSGLVYDGVEFRSLASYPELSERLVLVNGFSKTYAMTGWRVGYAVAAKPIAAAIAKVVGHSTSNLCTVSQYAALAAIQGDQTCVEEMRRRFQYRRDLVCRILDRLPGVQYRRPEGTFYAFPEIGSLLGRSGGPADSVELCRWLLEKWHVAIVPGDAFGAPGHVRISFASSEAAIEEGLGRLASAFHELAGAKDSGEPQSRTDSRA